MIKLKTFVAYNTWTLPIDTTITERNPMFNSAIQINA